MGAQGELKATPLNGWHRANGGKMVDFGGWDMPVQYETGIIQEHLATRRYGGLFDVSHMGRFLIEGGDKLDFLQHVLTNNCLALDPWQSQYTIIPTATGGAIDDAFLYRFGPDRYILVVNAGNLDKDWAHLTEQARAFSDVKLTDLSREMALIALQGPLGRELLEGLAQGGCMPEPRQNNLAEASILGAEVLVSRTGYTGEPCSFELFVPADRAEDIWTALLQAGGAKGLLPVGLGARDTLRLEAGMPLYGHELGLDADGNEIPIFAIPLATVAVSLSPLKGEFIGREALKAQFEALKEIRHGAEHPPAALPKRIFPVALTDRGIARQGYEVYRGDRPIGRITSGTSCPYWLLAGEGAMMIPTEEHALRSLALAYLDSTVHPETEVEIAIRNKRVRAEVVKHHGRSEAPPYFHALPVGWTPPEREAALGRGLEKIKHLARRGLDNHRWRQAECLNLIPSEQTPSPLVRLLSVTDPVGRYAEHKSVEAAFAQEVFYYQGTDFIAWVEDRLAAEMADYLGCPLVEARAVSGQMANMTVFSALVSWKNRANIKVEPGRISLALTNHIGRGGHLSAQPMGALRDYIAKDPTAERFAVVNFPVLADDPFRIDLAETEKLLAETDPELIVLGKSMVLYREPVAEVRRILTDLGKRAVLMYDMAHVLGLVGPRFQQPFEEGADIVTGSTHKTFFGTQRGIIGANLPQEGPRWELWEAIRRRAFPGMVSNHHLGSLLGLLAAAIEMNAFRDDYQAQVLHNAVALAKALNDRGVKVCGDPTIGFTETHQVIVEVGYAQGPATARQLEEQNIIVNYQAIPSDEGFSASSGLRLGVSEMTRFGMVEADMEAVAELLAEAINGKPVKEKVIGLRSRFTELGFCFAPQDLDGLMDELIQTI